MDSAMKRWHVRLSTLAETLSGLAVIAATLLGDGSILHAQTQKVSADDFRYLGAFRLPEGGERPKTFAYGGNAMTFRPGGDPSGPKDGFPGSLFITGHDRMPYGELPDGNQVAEVTIPRPVRSNNLASLKRARFLQDFHDVAKGQFPNFMEIPVVGLEYLETPATGGRIHLAWGQHFEPETPSPTHAWIAPTLAQPRFRGSWFIGNQSFYSINGYLFEIPKEWADNHSSGRRLATGRYRDGGWSGLGPALFAYQPWVDEKGTPAASGTKLNETVLLRYESSRRTDKIERALDDYQHPDEWSGGAWITTKSGKHAILFAGTKGIGAKYWYGFVNPKGADYPCVQAAAAESFTACRKADGSPCPPTDMTECQNHDDMRGWWSARFAAQFILYDPDDLAAVASGQLKPWEPQPYTRLDIDKHLFLTRTPDTDQLAGIGPQRKHRTGGVAFDRASSLLYMLELFADGAAPVVHVWHIR